MNKFSSVVIDTMKKTFYQKELSKLLGSITVDHMKVIKEHHNSLKEAYIYCKINNLNGQTTGIIIENYFIYKYNMIKNNSRKCNGDVHHREENIEIKASNGGSKNRRFNFVQLRPNHKCSYILSCYYISKENLEECGECFIFKLDKEQIKDLIFKYGNYAHGTKEKLGNITRESLDDENNNNSYAIRPFYNSLCWNELLNFRIDESVV